jgi:WD40 repeat protein
MTPDDELACALRRGPAESWEDVRLRVEALGLLPAGSAVPASEGLDLSWEPWTEPLELPAALPLAPPGGGPWSVELRLSVLARRVCPLELRLRSPDALLARRPPPAGAPLALLGGLALPVLSLAFSPDGARLASGHRGGLVLLQDLREKRILHALRAHQGAASCLAFSPDGRWLASGGDDERLRVWATSTGALHASLDALSGPLHSLDFSPTSGLLAAASRDGALRLWDAQAGKLLRTLDAHDRPARAVAFSRDGAWLASAGDDGVLHLWDALARAPLLSRGLPGPTASLAFSPDGRWLASGDGERGLLLWEPGSWRALAAREKLEAPLCSLTFSAGGRWLASLDEAGGVNLWDPASGRRLRSWTLLPGARSLRFAPEGAALLVGDGPRVLRLDPVAGERVELVDTPRALLSPSAPVPGGWKVTLEGGQGCLWIEEGHEGAITALALEPRGRVAASGGRDGRVRLWELASGAHLGALDLAAAPTTLAFSPSGDLLAVCSEDREVIVWRFREDTVAARLGDHRDWATAAMFRGDGRRLATGSDDGRVRLWGGSTWSKLAELAGHEGWVRAVAWSPDGGQVASGGYDERVRLWDGESGRLLEEREVSGAPRGLRFAPGGQELLAFGASGRVDRWSLPSWRPVTSLQGHEGAVIAGRYTDDGREILTAGQDGTVRRWSTETGEVLGIQRIGDMLAADFDPSGDLALTGGWDETASLWLRCAAS